MAKVTISLVVPERIMALVQGYLQNWILVGGNSGFMSHLLINEVENPEQYLSEMEIGIVHPDDEPVKIMDFLAKENKKVRDWLYQKRLWSYMDMVLDEHQFSIGCLDEVNIDPPQTVLDFIQSVKATDCSYFRFVN